MKRVPPEYFLLAFWKPFHSKPKVEEKSDISNGDRSLSMGTSPELKVPWKMALTQKEHFSNSDEAQRQSEVFVTALNSSSTLIRGVV